MGMFGILQPLTANKALLSGTGNSPFLIRIVSVTGNIAHVLADGVTLEVRSEIPVAQNQIFLVTQDLRDDGTIAWRILREIPTSDSHHHSSFWGQEEAGFGEKNLCSSLSQMGLPLTESNLHKARQYLSLLGKPTVANALTAAIAVKINLRSPILMQALASFVSCLLEQQDGINKKKSSSKDVASGLKELCEGLKNLFSNVRGHSGYSLESFIEEYFHGQEELGKLLLAGQFFARAQGNSPKGAFYYIPLFLLATEDFFPRGEIFICPDREDGVDSNGCRVWLLLDTKNLGRVQINICCWKRSLQVDVLVEREETKLLFDRYWSELESVLQERELKLYWLGCRVGKLPRENFGLKLHRSLDLFV
jgi:hypothetical protein